MVLSRTWFREHAEQQRVGARVRRARAALGCAALGAVGFALVAEAAGPQPTFEHFPASPVSTGAEKPVGITVADVDGDGFQDLVVANEYYHVSVLLGDGAGGFSQAPGSPIEWPYHHSPQNVVVTEVNGDGVKDLVVSTYKFFGPHDTEVFVLNGTGGGSFGSPTTVDIGAVYPRDIKCADINGDGFQDILAISSNKTAAGSYELATMVTVLLGDGAGNFQHATGSPIDLWPGEYRFGASLQVGDVNGDTKPDLLARTSGDPAHVSVLIGDGTGGFTRTGAPIMANQYLNAFAVGDVNGDGKLDAVGVNYDGVLFAEIGNGLGAFTATPDAPSTGLAGPTGIAISDVNGDGKPDVLVAHNYDGLVVMLGDGAGGFTPRSAGPIPIGEYTRRVVAADVNGDGKPDVMSLDYSGNQVAVLKNTTIAADTTPPSAVPQAVGLHGASNNLPYVPIQVTDAGSGVKSIQLTANSRNVHLEYPLGTVVSSPYVLPSPAGSIRLFAVKNTNATARVEVRVTDQAGNSATADPIIANLQVKQGRKLARTFKGIPEAERYISLQNGTPGLSDARLWVNGKLVSRGTLTSGQVLELDVVSWMKPGTRNTARIVASGPKGASAVLTIGDVQTSGSAASPSAPANLRPRLNLEFSR